MPASIAFVMEQTLGHITHTQNLRAVVDRLPDLVQPRWLTIPFEPTGYQRFLPVLRSTWSVRASLCARRLLDRNLAEQRLDAILFHTQVTSLFSRAIMRRVPSVVSLDATPINFDSVGAFYHHRVAGNGFLDQQIYRLNKMALHAADSLVTWSEWAARSVVEDYGVEARRVHVIAPGAAPGYFEIGERRTEPTSLGLAAPKRRVRILFVGGDFVRKGGPLLVELMRGPLGEQCELHLVTWEAVEQPPNVHVHRGLSPNSPELVRLFEEADVFVLPSRADCLPMALMEASAAGLPIITTSVGALREAILPGESGELIPPNDARALGQALEAMVANQGLRSRMGHASHELARVRFDAVRNNTLLLDIVLSAAGRPLGVRQVAA